VDHKFYIKVFLVFITVAVGLGSCTGAKETVANSENNDIEVSEQEKKAFEQKEGDTITIADDSTEYEIIIIEPGFNFWLNSVARPRQYYSQNYLENRNRLYVMEWNQRVLQPFRYSPNLYELQIDYSPSIDYGYEVNYKLYNYFIYFQRKYDQRLGPFVPRI
tara:strand:- start:46112 stop:46597 length:486 start_codon:yes stop_codon:yes gene_type:complete